MPVRINGLVGPRSQAGQSRGGFSLARNGSLLVQSEFAAAVEAGRCFAAANQSGSNSDAGLSTTPPGVVLVNPAGSPVRGRLWFAGAHFKVAPAAAMSVWLAVGENFGSFSGSAVASTVRNLKLGGQAGTGASIRSGNWIQVLAASVNLPSTPVAIALLGVVTGGAITTMPTGDQLTRYFAGGVILMPGSNVSIQTSTSSGAGSMLNEMIWSEEPIVD